LNRYRDGGLAGLAPACDGSRHADISTRGILPRIRSGRYAPRPRRPALPEAG
jgi:hypothetical protein